MSIRISIAKDFSRTPGLRYRTQSEFPGEDFRDLLLEPKFLQALENGEKLEVVLDGTAGAGPSFLEEAFGGLVRKLEASHGRNAIRLVDNNIVIISKEEEYLIADVKSYIQRALVQNAHA